MDTDPDKVFERQEEVRRVLLQQQQEARRAAQAQWISNIEDQLLPQIGTGIIPWTIDIDELTVDRVRPAVEMVLDQLNAKTPTSKKIYCITATIDMDLSAKFEVGLKDRPSSQTIT